MRARLVLLFLLAFGASCGPTCLEPRGEPVEAEFCPDATLQALAIIDAELEARGYLPVSAFVEVEWIPADTFVLEDDWGPGRDLYGR